MTGELHGAVAVVTGASSGIGEATARALAAEGASVALLARRRERLETFAREIDAAPASGAVHVYELDVSDAAAVGTAVTHVVEDLGGIAVFINNAGYGTLVPALEADFGELAEHHVRVGLVEPGVVATEMTTSGNPHTPDARSASELGALLADDIAEAGSA